MSEAAITRLALSQDLESIARVFKRYSQKQIRREFVGLSGNAEDLGEILESEAQMIQGRFGQRRYQNPRHQRM